MFLKEIANRPAEGMMGIAFKKLSENGHTVPEIMHLFRFKQRSTDFLIRFTDEVMRGPSPLSTGLRELIGSYVSKRNQCSFCSCAHAPVAAELLGKELVEEVLTDLESSRLPAGEKELLRYVGKVTEARLQELGIATVSDLRTLGLLELEQRFGRWGRRLHELSYGIDDNPVETGRPTLQISSEDTFEHDLPLDELEPHIRRLAEKTWAGYERERAGEHGRVARTVVLKLKTSDFRILTRSLTPPERPASLDTLVRIASELRARVPLPASTRYRLVGVGLSGFVDDEADAQSDLFG